MPVTKSRFPKPIGRVRLVGRLDAVKFRCTKSSSAKQRVSWLSSKTSFSLFRPFKV